MNDKLYNLIADPNVCFYLKPTPTLQNMLVVNGHPLLQNLKETIKASLISGDVILIDRGDVYKFIMGGLTEEQHFLLKNGDIRVAGEPQLKLYKKEIRET